jgi:hypothetical protein
MDEMNNKMKPEIKQKWLEALRSGEYRQGISALRSHDDRYCCLGVLCDLHSKETGDKWEGEVNREYLYHDSTVYPPATVVEWVGGHLPGVTLACMNDLCRTSFAKIADWIEENL